MADSARRSGPTTQSDAESNDVGGLVEVAARASRSHALARGFLLGVVVAAAMGIFIVQNTAAVGFEWLWFDFEADLWLVLLVNFAAGLIAGPLLVAGWRRSAREQASRQRLLAKFKRRRTKSPANPQANT